MLRVKSDAATLEEKLVFSRRSSRNEVSECR